MVTWAEAHQYTEIALQSVAALRQGITDEHGNITTQPSMSDVDPIVFNNALWGVFNYCVTGEGRVVFNNVEILHGLEAWSRIVVPLKARTQGHRHAIDGRIHNPPQARGRTQARP